MYPFVLDMYLWVLMPSSLRHINPLGEEAGMGKICLWSRNRRANEVEYFNSRREEKRWGNVTILAKKRV